MTNPFRLLSIFLDYRRRTEIVHSMPMRLWVESATPCNLRCPMCLNKNLPAAEKKLMDLGLFKKIVDEAKHFVNDMYLHHRGEPLMNPALFDMIKYANAAGIKTRFHTNGTLLDSVKAEKLLDAGPHLVSISVDGFNKEAYEQMRVGGNFDKTVANILNFAESRRTKNLKKPYIVIEKIKFRKPPEKENEKDTTALKKRFLQAGVDEVIEKDEYVWAEEGAPEPAGKPAYTVCTFPWYAMTICADGKVTPCPQDYYGKMAMGNVNNSTLKEIWNGDAYRGLRRKFKTDLHSLVICHKCDRLYRKTIGGIPVQYMVTFLVDQLVGYNKKLRKLFGTSERN